MEAYSLKITSLLYASRKQCDAVGQLWRFRKLMYLLNCKPLLLSVVHCLKVPIGLEPVSFRQDQYSKQHCLLAKS
jgi:hypothetical protein